MFYQKNDLIDYISNVNGLYIGTTRSGWRRINRMTSSMTDFKLINQAGVKLFGRVLNIYKPTALDLKEERVKEYESMRTTFKSIVHPVFIHWICRSLYYLIQNKIGSKTESCDLVTKLTKNNDILDLVNKVRNIRFPYPDNVLKKKCNMKYGILELMKLYENIELNTCEV